MTNSTQDYVKWFRHSSPYINAHRGKTFVLMLPGEGVRHENFCNIIHDIALLNSLGVRLVLVHGARPQIDERLQQVGRPSQFAQRLRITEPQDMPLICQAVGETRIAIEAALSTGLPSSPMHGSDLRVVSGNFVTAMPQGVIEGTDFHLTGKVRRIDANGIASQLDQQSVVLVSPLGYSPTGEMFNVSFADVATQVAIALKADKLLSFVEPEGLIDAKGELLHELTLPQCELQLARLSQQPAHGMRLALTATYDACCKGVPRAQIVSYAIDGALLQELFTRDGSGTMVYRDSYEVIRRARIEDVGGILDLIKPLEEEGILVRRSRELLEAEISHFTLVEKDGLIIACAALYPSADGSAGELACVATQRDYQGSGLGAKLLTHIERQARKLKLQQLFVLTTQTSHWFQEQGFAPGDLDLLPEERKSLYNYQRNSKVFVKEI